jgi:hypothetical protein
MARGRTLNGFALVTCLLCVAQPAGAGDTEQRDYAVIVNGKEAGQLRLTIVVENDGNAVVTASAQVKFASLLFNYTYSVVATEWWKDGKLTGLKSVGSENGKGTEVTATGEGNQLRIRVNGRERLGPMEVWTASFWKLADARYHNKPVPILEPDSGKEYTGQLQYIGTEQLTFLNQPQSCYRFHVSGGAYPIELWFDRYHRLVRQEFTDAGHKTIVQLVGLKR